MMENSISLAEQYAASTFREGVLAGRQQAINVLLKLSIEGAEETNLVDAFIEKLNNQPFPSFRGT